MDGFHACPSCYAPVDVVKVRREESESDNHYYFVNCKECGKGTTEAYESVHKLKEVWNDLAQKEKAAFF